MFKANKGHQRSNLGRTRLIAVESGRLVEIYHMHMFRLRILSEIQNYLRSNQVIKTSEVNFWSNLSKKSQIGLFGPIKYNIDMFF